MSMCSTAAGANILRRRGDECSQASAAQRILASTRTSSVIPTVFISAGLPVAESVVIVLVVCPTLSASAPKTSGRVPTLAAQGPPTRAFYSDRTSSITMFTDLSWCRWRQKLSGRMSGVLREQIIFA
jgi:hypothetical protein